jgi:hypothetical protein
MIKSMHLLSFLLGGLNKVNKLFYLVRNNFSFSILEIHPRGFRQSVDIDFFFNAAV